MRVVHVINSLAGSGGAEQGLVREIQHLEREFDQEVVALYEGGQLAHTVEDAGVPIHRLGLDSDQSGWNWTLGARRLRRLLDALRPQVVHSSLASSNLISQLATRQTRVPVLSTFTLSGDVSLMKSYQPGANSWKASLFRFASAYGSRLDHVWFRAITRDASVTNARALGVDEERVVVIPRGVPMSEEVGDPPHELKQRLELPLDRPILLNVGRQTAQKGHAHLIESFQAVLEHGPAHLVILGREGDATKVLWGAIEAASLRSDVTVIPYTDRVRDFYRAADVFVFPSLMEGLGTAVLEAMGEGLPVVGFDIPPVSEITDRGRVAVLVETGNTAQLSVAVRDVLGDSDLRERLSKQARSWTRENFSIEAVSTRLAGELRRLGDMYG